MKKIIGIFFGLTLLFAVSADENVFQATLLIEKEISNENNTVSIRQIIKNVSAETQMLDLFWTAFASTKLHYYVLKNNEYTRLQRINYASISFSVPETFNRYKSLAPQEELQFHTEVVYKFIASEFIADELELDTSIYIGYVLDDEREGLFYPVPADVNEIIVVSASDIDGHYFQSDPAVIKIMR